MMKILCSIQWIVCLVLFCMVLYLLSFPQEKPFKVIIRPEFSDIVNDIGELQQEEFRIKDAYYQRSTGEGADFYRALKTNKVLMKLQKEQNLLFYELLCWHFDFDFDRSNATLTVKKKGK